MSFVVVKGFTGSRRLCGENEKRARKTLLPGPTSFETRVKRKLYFSSAKSRRLRVAKLTSPAPNSISDRGGFGSRRGRNADAINTGERVNKTSFPTFDSFLSPFTSLARASTMPNQERFQLPSLLVGSRLNLDGAYCCGGPCRGDNLCQSGERCNGLHIAQEFQRSLFLKGCRS